MTRVARILLVAIGLAIAVPALAEPAAGPITRTLDTGWEVRLAPGDANAAAHKAATRWLPARVPGSVQTDLLAAHLLAARAAARHRPRPAPCRC